MGISFEIVLNTHPTATILSTVPEAKLCFPPCKPYIVSFINIILYQLLVDEKKSLIIVVVLFVGSGPGSHLGCVLPYIVVLKKSVLIMNYRLKF